MSENTMEGAKAAPITLHGRLLEEHLQQREYIEALERYMSNGMYQHLPFICKVLAATQLAVMKLNMWLLQARMKRV